MLITEIPKPRTKSWLTKTCPRTPFSLPDTHCGNGNRCLPDCVPTAELPRQTAGDPQYALRRFHVICQLITMVVGLEARVLPSGGAK